MRMKRRCGSIDRLGLRLLFVDPPLEKRLAACLQLMGDAAAEGDVVWWLFLRHRLACEVMSARSVAINA
jgi:hypothetical protein